MELESMFTDQKWKILDCLAKQGYSPLQLARETNTTISNISQQLKLLEASGLVKKVKVKNRDKGKPRSIFTLSQDYAYFISLTSHFAAKKLLVLSDYHKIILKIWATENASLHEALTNACLPIISQITEFDLVYLGHQDDQTSLNFVVNGSKIAPKLVTQVRNSIKESGKGVLVNSHHSTPQYLRKMQQSLGDIVVLHARRDFFNDMLENAGNAA